MPRNNHAALLALILLQEQMGRVLTFLDTVRKESVHASADSLL